jgi:uncharacterized protein YdcH (DUF465 family)
MTHSERNLLIAGLLKKDHEFKKLYKEHEILEAQLDGFNGRVSLTPEDEVERKKIQKRKLQQKDRMEEILRNAQGSPGKVAFA